jgi:tRNA (cmo5U34)-methyltransferase
MRMEPEADWEVYRALAPAAVPRRPEQLATILTLFPFAPDDSFAIAELGAGEGFLSLAALESYHQASVLALDGSQEMLARATRRLERHPTRGRTGYFELASDDWLPAINDFDVVVSSLCVHHLDGDGKSRLFGAVIERLAPGGALLIADLVAPTSSPAERLFADTWDDTARRQSIEETGSHDLFDMFLETQWNIYRYPDPMDKPSPLFDQLKWLEAAGFTGVDCFWMSAAHAIYGGYKSGGAPPSEGLSYPAALRAAEVALRTELAP